MSPPQVNLAVKEPPTVSNEELPMEKKEKMIGNAAIVTVETEMIRVKRAKFQARRRRRVVCCVSLIAVVLITAAVVVLFAVRHHQHKHHDRHEHHGRKQWNCKVGKDGGHENVQVDFYNQLIYALHQHTANKPAMHILNEYGRRMAAYKDVDNNICYITRLDETFEEGYARWEGYEVIARDTKTLHVFSAQRVEMLVLKHVTDVHIEAHCHNAKSYWAVEIDEKEVQTYMRIVKV